MFSAEVEKLTEIGFRLVGTWRLEDDALRLDLHDGSISGNTLYAFVVDGSTKYIGKTVQPLVKRLYGYTNPGPTQTTNQRGNKHLRMSLANGSQVEVYALPDNGLIHYGAFHLNLAAGLEDSLVSTLQPEWNITGSTRRSNSGVQND